MDAASRPWSHFASGLNDSSVSSAHSYRRSRTCAATSEPQSRFQQRARERGATHLLPVLRGGPLTKAVRYARAFTASKDGLPAMFYDRFAESVRRFPDLIAVELQHESSAVAAGAPPVESYTFAQFRNMAESVGNGCLQIRHQARRQVRLSCRQSSLVGGRLSRRARLGQHRRPARYRLSCRSGPQVAARLRRRAALLRPPASCAIAREAAKDLPVKTRRHRRRGSDRRRLLLPTSSPPGRATSSPFPSPPTTSR